MPWIVYKKTDELYHHGILGQKWGTKNGPPYPLTNSDRSSSEKKQNKQSYAQFQKDFPHKGIAANSKLENKIKANIDNYKDDIDKINQLGKEASQSRKEAESIINLKYELTEKDPAYTKARKERDDYRNTFLKNHPNQDSREIRKDEEFLKLDDTCTNAKVKALEKYENAIEEKYGKRIDYLNNNAQEKYNLQTATYNKLSERMLNDLGYEATEDAKKYATWTIDKVVRND